MSNSFCIILASTDGRQHILEECVNCLKTKYRNVDTFLYYQGSLDFDTQYFKGVICDNNLRGVFTPRYELMKQYCLDYDYTIIIDDDLFITRDTNYEDAIKEIEKRNNVGCVTTLSNVKSANVKHKIVLVDETTKYWSSRYNVGGGMILPRNSIKAIIDYFKDKEHDYTEDQFWLLLYVKGYDLYIYLGSTAIHKGNAHVAGDGLSGYIKYIREHEYSPILTKWYDQPSPVTIEGKTVVRIKNLNNLNDKGRIEREKNRINGN